jgi:large subunit ribosomal protein L14
MIQVETKLDIIDNSRAKYAKCIKVFKGKYAKIGDIVLVSLKYVKPPKKNQKSKIKKGQVCRALVLRTKNRYKRKNGSLINFSQNAALLLNSKDQPLASRAFGPTLQELRKLKTFKIISMISYLV